MQRTADYDRDLIAWADEQARFLRAGQFDRLDLEHLAEEIEEVGKSEQRELASRLALLLMHLLKWQLQPQRRGSSCRLTIREQRRAIEARLARTPRLEAMLRDPSWWEEIWADALAATASETGLASFPEQCPWPIADILDPAWAPETPEGGTPSAVPPADAREGTRNP